MMIFDRYINRKNSSEGFTLIEVIVTIAIMSITLVMIMRLFSMGLRASKTSGNYTTAIVHARGIMEELTIDPVQGSGTFEDDFEWESEVQEHEELNIELEETGINVMKLSVIVYWNESVNKRKSVNLVTLKMVEEDDDI
jgi:general secretion pathway protein I